MFGSGVLDTIIGTCFVFLLVSVLVTIANELISAALFSRAKWLRIGIVGMLESDWATKLYAHPLIEGSTTGGNGEHGPSYIPSRAFANVLLDLIREHSGEAIAGAKAEMQATLDATSEQQIAIVELMRRLRASVESLPDSGIVDALKRDVERLARRLSDADSASAAMAQVQRFIDLIQVRYLRQALEQLPNAKVRRTLLVLLDDAQGDVEKFKENIEIWFNNAMDRVGGWYKRKSQWIIVVLSVGAAVVVNVDAILIVKYLGNNVGVRSALVAEATAYAQQASPAAADISASGAAAAAASLRAVGDELHHLDLPIGWVLAPSLAASDNYQVFPFGAEQSRLGSTVLFHILGWLLTALAATLGAPFWFDTLNRFISIRSAGKAPEERPKPPRDVPVPLEPGQSPREADAAQPRPT